jgi:hypothetical protein
MTLDEIRSGADADHIPSRPMHAVGGAVRDVRKAAPGDGALTAFSG